jgi:hypothetical protein
MLGLFFFVFLIGKKAKIELQLSKNFEVFIIKNWKSLLDVGIRNIAQTKNPYPERLCR